MDQFESQYRKERLMNNKMRSEKECLYCKIGSGIFFFGFGLFHAFRISSIWKFYPRKEKLFNLAALGFLFTVSGANFNAAY